MYTLFISYGKHNKFSCEQILILAICLKNKTVSYPEKKKKKKVNMLVINTHYCRVSVQNVMFLIFF